MSKRRDAAWRLASMLADEAGVPVEAEWHPGRDSGGRPLPHGTTGRWLFRWADGPTVAAMRTRAEDLLAVSGLVTPLRKAALAWERNYSDRATALAVLDLARDGKLSGDNAAPPHGASWVATVAEIDLHNTAYPTDRPVEALIAADVLNAAAGGYGDAWRMADLLVERGRDELGIDAWPAPLAPGEPLRGRWVWGAWPIGDSLRTRIIERRPRSTPQPPSVPETTEPRNETEAEKRSRARTHRTARGETVRRLAAMLADEAGVPVEAVWRAAVRKGDTGMWVLVWTDGPVAVALRTRAKELLDQIGELAPVRRAKLGWMRNLTGRAVALALLDLARDGRLPGPRRERTLVASTIGTQLQDVAYPTDRPREALIAGDTLSTAGRGKAQRMADLLVERGRDELGIDAWPAPPASGGPLRGRWVWGAWPQPGTGKKVVERRPRPADHPAAEPETEPTTRATATPGPPATAPTCPVCGGPVRERDRGRPARYCSARCRLRAHRAEQRTEQRNETPPCEMCGRPLTQAATGRRRRYCSAKCRRRAWQARHGDASRYVLAYSAVDGWCLHAGDDPVPRDTAGPDISADDIAGAQRWAAELITGTSPAGWTETTCPYGSDHPAFQITTSRKVHNA